MATWASKDPDAVLDYVYRVPLDTGDSVATHSMTRLSGTVNIESEGIASTPDMVDGIYGQAVTAWVSGGADRETSVFRIAWETTGGRSNDDVITLNVIESDVTEPLALTGYAKPDPAHLIARYSAFSTVPASTIQYWLTDAERSVDTSWGEGDYATALMALAAHNMALAGLGGSTVAIDGVPAGVTNLKSGALSVSVTPEAANALVTGGYAATPYGQEFEKLLRRNRGGPLVSSTGVIPMCGYYPWGIGGYTWPG